MQHVSMIGIDYNRAPVDVRALFAFTKKASAEAMHRLIDMEGIQGCIILSTCNRMELWVSTRGEDFDTRLLYNFLCEEKGLDPKDYGQYFLSRRGRDAIEHLFYLTGGLKSQILAEDQIITQVKDALNRAREEYCTDSILEVLFRMAVTAAKKVKTEVVFSRGNVSVIHQALAVLAEKGFCPAGKKCMVIGNGEMGKVTALALKDAGADVTVTVRQYRSGVVNIPEGCSRINYGERMELLPYCDMVVSATASPNYTITKELYENTGVDRNIVMIDLAVPRDIEPSVAQCSGVSLYDIDSFRIEPVSESLSESMEAAAEIIGQQIDEFELWLTGRNMLPKIHKIQDAAAEDMYLRVLHTLKKDEQEELIGESLMEAVESAAAKVTGKLLFGIRDMVGTQEFEDCIRGLEKLYEE